MDIELIATKVAEQLNEQFGHQVIASTFNESRTRGGDEHFSLPIKGDFGIFNMIMKSAEVRVSVGTVQNEANGEHYHVHTALHYTHVSGGSNGSNIGTYWFAKTGELIGFREG